MSMDEPPSSLSKAKQRSIKDVLSIGDKLQAKLAKIRLPHWFVFVCIAATLAWGALAPIKEFIIASVTLDTEEFKSLSVKPNYEGYTVFCLIPVHWLIDADTPAVWESTGYGVKNINSK